MHPEGFEKKSKDEELVCKLRKSLYGLKQFPRHWNKKFDYFVTSIGFKSGYDPCLYYKGLKVYNIIFISFMWIICS